MKHKNLLILSVTALAAAAIVTSAQETGVRRTQAAVLGDGQARDAEGKTFTTRLTSVIKRSSNVSRMLVIPKDTADAKGIAEVEEDLNVMAHILAKAVSGDADKSSRAMGIAVAPRPPGSATGPQNLFIEGYGALFFLNVNYPLVPPPATDTKPEPRNETSNEWDQARREISQPQRYGSSGSGSGGGWGGQGPFPGVIPEVPFPPGGNAPEYDAARVEELKSDVIAALKNAAHIRRLKSDETITVVISAPGSSGGAKTKGRTSGDSTPDDFQVSVEPGVMGTSQQYTYWSSSSGPSTKLIFRARKADAEAFQSGKLSFDEFRKKVSVILY